jgi:hypothetical protein
MNDNLRKMGVAREIVNSIQQLRKGAGINIDDHVEIYYKQTGNEGENSLLT